MSRKLWIGAAVVFVVFVVLNFLIHTVLLKAAYEEPNMPWRSPDDVMAWLIILVYFIFSFFFVFVFGKGYEGKGMMEGVRYGFYIGVMVFLPYAYVNYAVFPDIPYPVALQWFIYGVIEFVIAGAVLAAVMGSGGGGGTSEE